MIDYDGVMKKKERKKRRIKTWSKINMEVWLGTLLKLKRR